MSRVSFLTLLFAILSFVFTILIVFLRMKFQPYPLISYQDVVDLLTPLVLIPLYWLLFKLVSSERSSTIEEIVFIVFAVLWIQGQGMHLAANSINNLISVLAQEQVIDVKSTDIYTITYFFDEQLSHYIWHIGILGMAALLIYREWKKPARESTVWWAAILGGIIYGFTIFGIFLEGRTVVIGLPFTILVVILSFLVVRKDFTQRPVATFFFVSCLFALILFVGWGLYWGGFPEFSEVGII